MDNTLLLSYQIEYETTNLSIDDLCIKYSIKPSQLKGHEQWTKREKSLPIVPPPLVQTSDIQPAQLLDDIATFKQKAVKHALTCIDNTQYMEVKEFRDLVAIIDTVEKSITKTEQLSGINIVIQNIMNEYQDDC